MNKKKTTIFCFMGTNFKTESDGMDKDIPLKCKLKKAWVAIPISDNVGF